MEPSWPILAKLAARAPIGRVHVNIIKRPSHLKRPGILPTATEVLPCDFCEAVIHGAHHTLPKQYTSPLFAYQADISRELYRLRAVLARS